MSRTVKKILDADKKKLSVGTQPEDNQDDALLVDDAPEGENLVDDKTSPVEDEAADLRKQVVAANARADREAAAREEAETRAGTASATANNAVQSQIITRKNEITAKISGAKTNLDSIKAQLKQARTVGDSDAEVELQDAMTNARYELNTAEWEKKNFETWEEGQKNTVVKEVSTSPYTGKERAWISKHPEFNSNKKFARLAKIAAQEARDEGIAQDSTAYFNYIEDALKEQGLIGEEEEPLSGAGGNTNSSTAATPQKTSGSPAPVGKNAKYPFLPSNFRIPPDWVQAAEDQGFDDVREYANMRLEDDAAAKAAR